jgi:hypothetical protein
MGLSVIYDFLLHVCRLYVLFIGPPEVDVNVYTCGYYIVEGLGIIDLDRISLYVLSQFIDE